MFWIAVGIFGLSLLLFVFERIDKTIVAATGAVLLMITGVLSWEQAIDAIDFETIALLLGLMLTVGFAQHSGIFSWLNTKIAEISGGSPLSVFVLFCLLTFLTSTILNNATVVLLVIPVAIALSNGLGLNTKLTVIGIAIMSNIGGTLTLIGDPPNTIIGVQAGLSFNQFILNLGIPVLVMTIFIFLYLIAMNWRDLKPIVRSLPKTFISQLIIQRITYLYQRKKLNKRLVFKVILVILATVVAFVIQPVLGVSVGVIGLASGLLLALLVMKKIPFMTVMKEVEWDSLVFFAALFIQVGALEQVGFLEMITEWISGFADNYALLLMVIVWGIGLASTIINNIPFVALMIPVIFDLQTQLAGEPHLDLLWWALALGACLGGNGTIIGSSSGIIALDLAKKNGVKISFWEFAKVGMPVTIISLAVSSVYLLVRVQL